MKRLYWRTTYSVGFGNFPSCREYSESVWRKQEPTIEPYPNEACTESADCFVTSEPAIKVAIENHANMTAAGPINTALE